MAADGRGGLTAVRTPGSNRRRRFIGQWLGGTLAAAGGSPGAWAELNTRVDPGNILSVRDFGAAGNNTRDDTAAIQGAIDAAAAAGRGTVYFPTGRYKVTSTLFIRNNYIGLRGASFSGSRLIASGDFGDVIHVRPTGAAANIQNVTIADLTVYTGEDTTSGAALRLEKCNYCAFSHLNLGERFGGIWVDSSSHCYFDNIFMTANFFWTSKKVGSYLLKVNAAAGASPSELHFSNCDWRGNSRSRNYLQYAVLLESVDGIWFTDLHCGFCYDCAFAVIPKSDTSKVSAVVGTNVYVDMATKYGLHIKEYSDAVREAANCVVLFNGMLVYNCEEGLRLDHRYGSVVLSDVTIVEVNHGLNFMRGIASNVTGARITDVNSGLSAGYGVLVGAHCAGLNLSQIYVRKRTRSATAGIRIADGATGINVNGASFEGCATDIADDATAPSKWFADILSDKAVQTVRPTAGNLLTLPSAYSVFKLEPATAVSGISAASGWKNRTVVLISTGTCTVKDGGNLKIAGNWTPKADDTLVLVCDGTNWYETSRSAN